MKIAILAPESFPRLWGSFAGGITQYVAAIATGYCSLGHEVHVFAFADEDGTVSWSDSTIHYITKSSGSELMGVGSLILDEVRMYRAFRAESKRRIFDIVEVIDWRTPALLSLRFVRHGPYIVKLHGPSHFIAVLNEVRLRRRSRLVAARERAIARRADLLLSADPGLATTMAGMWGLPYVPMTLPDPVDAPYEWLTSNASRQQHQRIVAVGRLEHRKDQATLIRALNRRADLEWSATLIGPDTSTSPSGGSYKAYLLEQAEPRVRERLEFVDHMNKDELWNLYVTCDVAVVCTPGGNYSYTTLDAMAACLPVIAPVGFDSTYARHRENAMLYPAGDDEALASALVELNRDHGLGVTLAIQAQSEIQHYLSPARIAGRALGLLGR